MLSVRQLQEWASLEQHEDYTDTTLTTLLLRWINEGLQDVASAENWKWLEGMREFTYGTHGAGATTASGITYLPHYVHRLVSVWPSGLSYRNMVQIIAGQELDMLDPSTVTGSPAEYLAVWGYYNVARDNPTTGVITVADAGLATFQVHIEGIDANGYEAEETVAVAAGAGVSTTRFLLGPDGVRRCYIVENSVTVGAPTIVTFTSTGTLIERLNYTVGELQHEHIRTELSPAPATGGANYVTRYMKRIRPVTAVTDTVDIPFEFENLLKFAVGKRLASYTGQDTRMVMYEQQFQARLRELIKWQNRQPGRMRALRPISNNPSRWPY